jgi:hypothetical protein
MIIVDVEASGLHQHSYPIEIAWQDSEKPESFDSFLIVPLAHWCHWDDYAESEIHHISHEQLFDSGITVNEACERLNSALINQVIYSDAVEYDQRWIIRLFDETEIKPTFNFVFSDRFNTKRRQLQVLPAIRKCSDKTQGP